MKFLYVLFSCFSRLVRKNKLLFILVIFCLLLSSVVTAYCYGNTIRLKSYEGSDYRIPSSDECDVMGCPFSIIDPEKWEKLLNDERVNDVYLYYDFHENDTLFYFVASPNDRFDAEYYGFEGFDEDQSDQYVAVGPQLLSFPDGSFQSIYDYRFQILKTGYQSKLILIPFSIFRSMGCADSNRTYYKVGFKDMTTKKALDFYPLLEEVFPEGDFGGAWYYFEMGSEYAPYDFFAHVMPFVLIASVTLIYLLGYMIRSTGSDKVIYTLCGADSDTIGLLAFLEAVVPTALFSALGLLIHALLYDVVFENLNVFSGITYSFGEYLIIWAAIVLVASLSAIPVTVSFRANSVAALKNKYGE